MSLDSKKIPFASHILWFMKTLQNPNTKIFIGENNVEGKIGVCRFEWFPATELSEISISVRPGLRGLGFGSKLLTACLDGYQMEHGGVILARVKSTNYASVRVFESSGFEVQNNQDCITTFKYDRRVTP